MTRFRLLAGLTFAACLTSAAAENELLDTSFGNGGILTLPDVPSADYAVAACPGPDGTEVIVGRQIGAGTVSVVRLLDDGSRDLGFGDQGLTQFTVSATPYRRSDRSLCQNNGVVVIAQETIAGKLELHRIGADGYPDPSWAGGAALTVDLAAFGGSDAWLRGMDPAPGREILLTGSTHNAFTGIGGKPFIMRIAANGSIRDGRVFEDAQLGAESFAAAAAYTSNGSLMLAGTHMTQLGGVQRSSWYRATLNGVDLSGGVSGTGPIGDFDYWLSGGRQLPSGELVVSAVVRGNPGFYQVLRLLVFRETGVSEIVLPSGPMQISFQGHSVQPEADGHHVLVAAGMRGGGHMSAFYFSRAHIGDSAAEDRVDTAFGEQGLTTARYISPDPSCGEDVAGQEFVRVSLWDSRPVFVGLGHQNCTTFRPSTMLLGRLKGDQIFADPFEQIRDAKSR